MNYIVHYTSALNWSFIQKGGNLLPFTEPLCFDEGTFDVTDTVRKIICKESYLVGILENTLDAWKVYGLDKHLKEHTTKEILLEVPIFDREHTFVREHAHWSPKRIFDLYNIDIEKQFHNKDPLKDSRMKMQIYKYFIESVVRLNDYKGQYVLPEIWCPQVTPIKYIKDKSLAISCCD